jgi:uncharacterized protein
MLLLQKGDELLDYKDAESYLKDSKVVEIDDGGSHKYDDFEKKFDNISAFAKL